MSTIQIIGIIIALASLTAIVLVVSPLGAQVKELGARWRHRPHEPAPPEEADSFFAQAPRDELERLGEHREPSSVGMGPSAVAEVAAGSEPDADTPTEELPVSNPKV
jgi:hypothetical protein